VTLGERGRVSVPRAGPWGANATRSLDFTQNSLNPLDKSTQCLYYKFNFYFARLGGS